MQLVSTSLRFLVGAVVGVVMALALSLLAGCIFAIAAMMGTPETGFLRVVLGYFISLPLAFGLVGVFWPLARHRLGGALLGGIGYAVILIAFSSAIHTQREWIEHVPWYAGLGSIGGAIGTFWHYPELKRRLLSPGESAAG